MNNMRKYAKETEMTSYNTRNSRLYRIWNNMKRRCKGYDPHNARIYKDRGITVCEEWQNFKPFMKWALASGYSDDLTIDRLDPFKDYCPENCRWATYTQQNLHLSQRKSQLGERNIRMLPYGTYEVRFTHNKKSVHVGCYKTLEEARKARDEWVLANAHY